MNHPSKRFLNPASSWPSTRQVGTGVHAVIRFLAIVILVAVPTATADQPVAAETESVDSKAAASKGPYARVRIEGFDGDQHLKNKKSGFSASEILDIVFKTRLWNCPEGDHLLELKLLTPNGHLYQVLTIPVSVGAKAATAKANKAVKVDGFPKALEVQSIETNMNKATKRHFATATLEVAGTFITTNSLYGMWEVEAFLDGEQIRMIGNRNFKIQP